MRPSCLFPRIDKALFGLALLCVGLSSSPALWAKGQFEVPADCGDRAQFEASVRERMGSDASALLDSMDLSIERHAETHSLFMRVGAESRHLDDRDCKDLFRAAVVVAVALWEAPAPLRQLSEHQSPGLAPTSEPPASTEIPKARRLQSMVSTPRGRVQLLALQRARRVPEIRLSCELGLSQGLQPDLFPAIGLRSALDFESFGIAATLRFLPPNRQQDGNGRGVSVLALGGHLAGYFKPISRLGIEAGVSSYYVQGKGIGSHTTATSRLAAVGPFLGFWAILWQSDAVFLSFGADGQLELLRPRFEILGYNEVFRVSRVVWGSNLAAGFRFH